MKLKLNEMKSEINPRQPPRIFLEKCDPFFSAEIALALTCVSVAAIAPIRVAVTGAAGFIAYSLLPLIAAGDAFVSGWLNVDDGDD